MGEMRKTKKMGCIWSIDRMRKIRSVIFRMNALQWIAGIGIMADWTWLWNYEKWTWPTLRQTERDAIIDDNQWANELLCWFELCARFVRWSERPQGLNRKSEKWQTKTLGQLEQSTTMPSYNATEIFIFPLFLHIFMKIKCPTFERPTTRADGQTRWLNASPRLKALSKKGLDNSWLVHGIFPSLFSRFGHLLLDF